MYTSIIPLVGWSTLVGALLFAWFKGEAAERWGASLKVLTSALAFAVHHLFKLNAISTSLLALDGLLAVGFLVLALRYASLWLGAAMLIQGAQFSLHAYYLVMAMAHDRMYSIINNINTFAIIGCIIAGTAASWMRRRATPADL